MISLFNWVISRFHVNLPGCTDFTMVKSLCTMVLCANHIIDTQNSTFLLFMQVGDLFTFYPGKSQVKPTTVWGEDVLELLPSTKQANPMQKIDMEPENDVFQVRKFRNLLCCRWTMFLFGDVVQIESSYPPSFWSWRIDFQPKETNFSESFLVKQSVGSWKLLFPNPLRIHGTGLFTYMNGWFL